ncbi:MAG: protein kinase [Mollicutes bacterium]|nr:protein kinase [Mollicutes bacterium]
MQEDEIIKQFTSGQKSVALVKNKDYGKCIRKTRNANTSTARMIREVEIQNTFDCNYYPKIYFSEVNSNNILIYEEYIEGEDLLEILKSNNIYKNNEIACLKLLQELIIALQYIWEKSIVHRDLKPSNIKLRNNKTPVILDLGIAKILDSSDNITTSMWFTEGYAPIEQFNNQNKMIDKRTDFFSLGVIIYELFFDQRLFVSNEEVIKKIPSFKKEGFRNSTEFNLIISKLLEKKIFNRYRKAEDILSDIKKALERR